MTDFLLDPNTNELVFENNDLVFVRGVDETVQRLRIKFHFFLREWYEDPTMGIPWYEQILVKNPFIPSIEQIFRKVILDDENIDRIVSLNVTLGADRVLRVSFKAIDNNEEVIDFKEFRLDGLRNNNNGI